MEGRKARRMNSDSKNIKEKKNINKLNLTSKILVVAMTLLLTVVLGVIIYLNVLPNKYLIPLCIAAVAWLVASNLLVFRKNSSKRLKVILSTLSGGLIIVLVFIILKLSKTISFLGGMTTDTVNSKTYSIVVLKDSKYEKIDDLQYKLIMYYDTELNQNAEAVKKLEGIITIGIEKVNDVHELANKLIAGNADAILIEDSYNAIIEEEISDFKDKTKVIYTYSLEDAVQTITKDVSVTKEPFVVYISGIDSYGKISSVARSDVNMICVVNPQTKQVLLVNTPRDFYVKLHGTSGYRDKLTHAGIYGIDMSVKTIEDLYNIDINYYVRVNFSSLINIIDAIGGVDVYSEYAFTSKIGEYKFKVGYNQMDGQKALGFARERYSFSNGDRMRGQNQQAVINAMIKKVCSSTTILTKFDALLDSLKGSFQTNMDYTKMIELVRMQIADGSNWNISSISVDGAGSMERTYSMGKTLLSVMIPYSGSVKQAETMIKSVLNGEMLVEGTIDLSKYNDYLVVSKGVYSTENTVKNETKIVEETEVEAPKVTGEVEEKNENIENKNTTVDNTVTPTIDTTTNVPSEITTKTEENKQEGEKTTESATVETSETSTSETTTVTDTTSNVEEKAE